MAGPRIIILTALHIESDAIARQFGTRAPKNNRCARFSHKSLQMEIHTIGVGAIALPALAEPARAVIIMAGLAGALDPALAIGDIVIDDVSNWPSQPLPFARRKIHTASQVISTVAEKAELFARTAAAAVEMENSAALQLAQQHQVPFIAIRSISDRADQTIDPAILKFVDPFGKVKAGMLIGSLVRQPRLLAKLRRLSRDSAVALKALGEAVEQVIQLAAK
jgi:adenosylhomocysteine nucleosidase